jgi:hypothetical protein
MAKMAETRIEQQVLTINFSCELTVIFNLVAGLLARSQYSEGPATGHLGTGFFWASLCL